MAEPSPDLIILEQQYHHCWLRIDGIIAAMAWLYESTPATIIDFDTLRDNFDKQPSILFTVSYDQHGYGEEDQSAQENRNQIHILEVLLHDERAKLSDLQSQIEVEQGTTNP